MLEVGSVADLARQYQPEHAANLSKFEIIRIDRAGKSDNGSCEKGDFVSQSFSLVIDLNVICQGAVSQGHVGSNDNLELECLAREVEVRSRT